MYLCFLNVWKALSLLKLERLSVAGWKGTEWTNKGGLGSTWGREDMVQHELLKGYLLVEFKLMLTLAVQLSWACAKRSLRDEEKVPTLSFSDRRRRVHLSRCDTSLMNREDRKSGTLNPIWSSETWWNYNQTYSNWFSNTLTEKYTQLWTFPR